MDAVWGKGGGANRNALALTTRLHTREKMGKLLDCCWAGAAEGG